MENEFPSRSGKVLAGEIEVCENYGYHSGREKGTILFKLFKKRKREVVEITFGTRFSLQFVERKDNDGSVVVEDTGERCLGFCEDYKPDEKAYKVQENLYISSQGGAKNLEELKKHNVTHILNVGSGIENAYPQVLKLVTCKIDLEIERASN